MAIPGMVAGNTSDQNLADSRGVFNPASTINDIAHLIKANEGVVQYGFYRYNNASEEVTASDGKAVLDDDSELWRENLHLGMWSKAQLFAELRTPKAGTLRGSKVSKSHKPRWYALQHNKLFIFSEKMDPAVIQKHMASSERRKRKQAATPDKVIPPDVNELPENDPRLNPLDVVYLLGATIWAGPSKSPPRIAGASDTIPRKSLVVSILENKGARSGRLTQLVCAGVVEYSTWFSALQAASNRDETEAHAVSHKFHMDERIAERLGLELKDLLSDRDPTTVFKNATRIGKGGLASVFKATNIQSGERVALKVMRVTASSFRFMLRELLQHKALSMSNCVDEDPLGEVNCFPGANVGNARASSTDPLSGLKGNDLVVGFRDAYYVALEGQLWIELEFMDLGALTSVLQPKFWPQAVRPTQAQLNSSEPGRFPKNPKAMVQLIPEPTIAFIAYRILQGVHWLHRCGRLHRDLKSDNILLSRGGKVKLADFGFIADLGEREVNPGAKLTRDSIVGTPYWMAPEVISGNAYGEAVDIWSFAVTIIECAQGVPPLFNLGPTVATTRIARQGLLPLSDVFIDLSAVSADFQNMLELCLAFNPADRATSANLLKHPFFRLRGTVDPATVFSSLKG